MKKIIIISTLLIFKISYSQDLVFGNFFNSAIYSNAAFTGAVFDSSVNNSRFQTSYRNQKIGQSLNVFQSNFLSYDQVIPKSNGSIGAYFISDRLGVNGMFHSTQANITYSYFTPFNKKGFTGRYGLSVGFKNQGIDLGELKFEDQIDYRLGIVRNSNEIISGNNLSRVDVNAGAIFHNQRFFIGLSMHNATKPNFDYVGRLDNYLPRRYSVQIGRLFSLGNRNNSLLPTASFIQQGKYSQTNLSICLNAGFFSIGTGIRNTMNQLNSISSSNCFVGIKNGKYKFRYMYETNFSKNKFLFAPTHELSVLVNFSTVNSKNLQNSFLMSY
jgi:type IX secretion system PorP/SprF family membrane protein